MPRFPADSAQVNTDSSQPSQYRFGPFTIDATRQVLLREGERVSLSAKSFDTLLALVRRYGATVSKSELLEAVWGEAVVEENSLNKCISEVRKALGDQRGRHDYIVTITGVGYRFVAPVSQALEPPGAAEAPRELKSALLFWSAAATAVLAAGALYLGLHHATPQRRLAVILPLKNLPATPDTGWLATAIGEMLYHELAAAPGPLRLMPPEDAARIDRDLPRGTAREIRNYSGAELALAGTVTVLSDHADKPLRIDLRVQNLRTGEMVAVKSVDGSESETFSLVRSLAEEVRQALGAAAAPSGKGGTPVPTSARAMQLYADGLAALRASDLSTAKDRLLEAVAADPSNALCYSALSAAWSGLGYDANAADAARRAFDLSSSLDAVDRLAIEARYRLATRDWNKAAELYGSIWTLVPESMENAAALLDAYEHAGRIDQARQVIARLRALPAPLRDDPRIDLLEAQLAGATWSDYSRMVLLTKQAAEKAQRRGMRALFAHARLMQSRAMWSAGEPGSTEVRHQARALCQELRDPACVALTLRGDGNANFLAGRLREAQESYNQALAAARQAGNMAEQLNELNGLGLLHGSLAEFDAADRYFREAFQINAETGRRDSAMLFNNHAHILTESGRLAEARQEAEAGLAAARTFHEVESEADALAALAVLDRIGGNPRNAVAMNRQALAVARQSGKKMAEVEIEFELARALATTGESKAAQDMLRMADSGRGSDDGLESVFAGAFVAFDSGDDASTDRLARATLAEAHKARSPYYEVRAESLLSLALLSENRPEEARAAAARAAAIRISPETGLARLEAHFVDVYASAGDLEPLAREAQQIGYIELAFEIRLAAAEHNPRLLRDVATDAARRGYAAIAARARTRYATMR